MTTVGTLNRQLVESWGKCYKPLGYSKILSSSYVGLRVYYVYDRQIDLLFSNVFQNVILVWKQIKDFFMIKILKSYILYAIINNN